MKTLVSVAAYGLVPVPGMPDWLSSSCDLQQITWEHKNDTDFLPFFFVQRCVSERLVTREELAWVRHEIEQIAKQAA